MRLGTSNVRTSKIKRIVLVIAWISTLFSVKVAAFQSTSSRGLSSQSKVVSHHLHPSVNFITPNTWPRQLRCKQYSNTRSQLQSNDQNLSDDESTEGSVIGAALLFAGTAVGAGMLALPAETMAAGFVPAIFGLNLCCIFTYVTSLIVLEAVWLVSCDETCDMDNEDGGGGFLLIARKALGVPGEVITAALFWFLLTAIIVAYTAEGGQLLSSVVKEVSSITIAPAMGSIIFAIFFAALATIGTSKVDVINRVFVFGLFGSFVALVATGLPMVEATNLFERSNWSAIYPTVISIGILSFGAQNVVPTLYRYLNNDPDRTRQAILYGTLMPLVLYSVWEAVFIGVVDNSAGSSNTGNIDVINVIGHTKGDIITDLVEIFSISAIGSSMAGASVSLVDFFQDATKMFSNEKEELVFVTPRLFATVLALGPPVILAYAFPDIFLVALEEAGLLGGVSLYGFLPALSIWVLRQSYPNAIMPGRLAGDNISLLFVAGLSLALIFPEIIHLVSTTLIDR